MFLVFRLPTYAHAHFLYSLTHPPTLRALSIKLGYINVHSSSIVFILGCLLNLAPDLIPFAMAKPSALLLLSGGPDSAVMAAWASQQDTYDCSALFVRILPIDEELRCAESTANRANLQLTVIDMIEPFGTLLKTGNHGPPLFSDMFTLSIAASFASTKGIDNIFSGIIKDDDDRLQAKGIQVRENVRSLEKIMRGVLKDFKLHTPFLDKTKPEVFSMGYNLSVDFKDTISCFRPVGSKHCGECDACQNRYDAFKKAEIKDPTEYNIRPNGKPIVFKFVDCCCCI